MPGQVYYNATRKLVLEGRRRAWSSWPTPRASKLDENLESLRNLEQNLNEHGMSLDEIPWVIQYNKRDVADAMAVADLDARLNPLRVPAHTRPWPRRGQGVYGNLPRHRDTRVPRVGRSASNAAISAGTTVSRRLSRACNGPGGASSRPRPSADVTPATRRDEFEFDTAIDSMLREMDSPAARPLRAPSCRRGAASRQRRLLPMRHVSTAAPCVSVTPVPRSPARRSAASRRSPRHERTVRAAAAAAAARRPRRGPQRTAH